jgi:hypothetical protein
LFARQGIERDAYAVFAPDGIEAIVAALGGVGNGVKAAKTNSRLRRVTSMRRLRAICCTQVVAADLRGS